MVQYESVVMHTVVTVIPRLYFIVNWSGCEACS